MALATVAVLLPSGGALPFLLLALLALAGSRWSVRRVARGVALRCSAPAWADFGQRLEAVVELRNTSRLPAAWVEVDVPCGMGLGRRVPHREALMLPPGAVVSRRVALLGAVRGRHHVGPPRVRLGDVLGVADVAVPAGQATSVTVFPRIVPLPALGLPAGAAEVTVAARRALLADRTRVVGVRDYEPGDPFGAIHWPATARRGRLAVKRYERAEARDTIICLDLTRGGYRRDTWRAATELAIVVAASVAQHTVGHERLNAGLVLDGGSGVLTLPPRNDTAHLRRLLEVLALAHPPVAVPLATLLATLDHRLGPGTTVLAVTGSVEPAAAVHLARLARRGVAVALALTEPAGDGLPPSGLRGVAVYRVADVAHLPALASSAQR